MIVVVVVLLVYPLFCFLFFYCVSLLLSPCALYFHHFFAFLNSMEVRTSKVLGWYIESFFFFSWKMTYQIDVLAWDQDFFTSSIGAATFKINTDNTIIQYVVLFNVKYVPILPEQPVNHSYLSFPKGKSYIFIPNLCGAHIQNAIDSLSTSPSPTEMSFFQRAHKDRTYTL